MAQANMVIASNVTVLPKKKPQYSKDDRAGALFSDIICPFVDCNHPPMLLTLTGRLGRRRIGRRNKLNLGRPRCVWIWLTLDNG